MTYPLFGTNADHVPERESVADFRKREAGQAIRKRSWWVRMWGKVQDSMPVDLGECPANFLTERQHGQGISE